MNQLIALCDAIEAHVRKEMQNMRELVQSDAFWALKDDERQLLIALRLKAALQVDKVLEGY